MGAQAGPIGVGQVEGHDLDAPAPPLGTLTGPFAQLLGTFAFDEVDHPPAIQVDEGRRVDGLVPWGRGQIAVLVDPQRADLADPPVVVDQGRAVHDGRTHDRVPAHPVLVGHRRDRSAELADLARHLLAGTVGEELARNNAVDPLGPGLLLTALGLAAPPALPQDET